MYSSTSNIANFQVNSHLCTLQTCLTTLMGHPISMEQLRLDVGHMVEKMTQITIMFRRIKLKMEEYVCLKVYILLNKGMFISGRIEYFKLNAKLFARYRSGVGRNSREICTSVAKLFTTFVTP